VVFQKRLGRASGSERSGPWLDGGCVVSGGSWDCEVEFRTTDDGGAGMSLTPLRTGSWLSKTFGGILGEECLFRRIGLLRC